MSITTTNHPLRPQDTELAQLWDIAAEVPDPEIPVISIADLGILRGVAFEGNTVVVTITPTYSGCPAMGTITADVVDALKREGFDNTRVDLVLHPAWSTDWMTEHGKEKLREYGIAPPQGMSRRTSGPILLNLAPPTPVTCPHCHSTNTKLISQFGSTSCKSLHTCKDCFEPFDYFKVH